MISRYVAKYSGLFTRFLAPKYIRFPRNVREINDTKAAFAADYNFPGVLGVIDGTQIAITALPKEIENAFMNRKGFHSINVQLVCNAQMIFTNVNARFPGSTHDAYIYGGSVLNTRLEEMHQLEPHTFNHLIGKIQFDFLYASTHKCISNMKFKMISGDSAYTLSPWMMKVFDGNNLNLMEQNFNRALKGVRQIIERSIGVLKVRFRCIMGERKLRYMPTKAGNFVYACATLHNFLIFNRYDILRDIDQNVLQNVVNIQNVRNANLPRDNFMDGRNRRNEVALHLQNMRI